MNFKQTKTGDVMHVNECTENDATYGIITIKLKKTSGHLNETEDLLIHFMERLQHVFGIRHTTGSLSEKFSNGKMAISDYWQDAAQKDWKVKGWTDGATLAVLYIKNISAVPVGKEDCFLNGSFLANV